MLVTIQPSLDGFCPIAEAVEKLANDSSIDERGAIFTRHYVVQFILDLVGYTSDKPLTHTRLLEPSFGSGEFLLAGVERLMLAFKAAGSKDDITDCIRAVELHRETFKKTKAKLLARLAEWGLSEAECIRLTSAWLISADFLLSPIAGRFDFVVGNPPYVRQEMIPSTLLSQYRKLYATLYDRADLYVPFIERSLALLSDGGQLALICANRWIKNKYGGPLRALVSKQFHLRAYVDMENVSAFESSVIAYPAITLIERSKPGLTAVATCQNIETESLGKLAEALRLGEMNLKTGVTVIESIGQGSEPWVLSSSDKRALLRRMEALFPTLEEAGCKVGIGVATGADKAFIGMMDELDVEPSRKLPLVTTKDISTGKVCWRGLGVVNPFEDDGKLADLRCYPKLRAHLERNYAVIAGRHVAQKAPANWYRTIDRITPSLALRPKLLVPDIKGSAHVVFEAGSLYPHHNLYFVISEEWDLRALQAVLLSSVARQFVSAYSTTMRGGFLRFQAQYLRRIRLPEWKSVTKPMRERLVKAAIELNLIECDNAAYALYGLTSVEANLLA